jgi:UDP-N-acetylmuramoylalanine--D-glutamate ligase
MQPFRPFAGLRIAVLGLGRAGLPAALRLAEWGAVVTAWDDGAPARAAAAQAGIAVAEPEGFDLLLISPGIPHRGAKAHPVAARAVAAGIPVTTDAELLFRAVRASGSGARFCGITGTNGKSTTTALVAHILAQAGIAHAAGANLGPAALSLPLLGDDGVYVLEMSSYMLDRVERLHFGAAAMLNLSPDHLDRHGDMAGYAAAKQRIFANQAAEDTAVIGMDDDLSRAMPTGPARRVPISGTTPQPGGVWAEGRLLRDAAGPLLDLAEAAALPGSHNAQNAAAAAALCLALGLGRDAIAAGIRSYPGLPHRMEVLATIAGVTLVNDSKGTNADSTARALAAYDRVVLIAGGVAKDGGIESLAPLFPRIAEAFLIGQSAADFAATLGRHGVTHRIAGTLDAATRAAFAAARAGAAPVVLLSPACASFDQFSGFEARGDAFRALVAGLDTRPHGEAA